MTAKAAKTAMGDLIDNLTGLQVKRVQSLTGSQIHEPDDYYGLLFALAYVRPMPPEQVKKWGKAEIEGFTEFQSTTTTKAVVVLIEGDDEDESAPKDAS
ncbi:hypothetical protein [Rhodococcoides fascians]|uniref:hypothetical protein n=1 Tax=Rhodococcoides fascians TaxID=1828 RepID=UPI00056C4F95|nr:hypothetical protein [Rhodococcus fascians]